MTGLTRHVAYARQIGYNLVTAMKKLLIRLVVTPERTRRWIAAAVSWFMTWCYMHEAWDTVKRFPKWLRRLADMIDAWEGVELAPDKEKTVLDLVSDLVTDEQVALLTDRLSAMSKEGDDGSCS